ncbi:hypothetical protein HY212_01100 [Candidatus Pacearchaeota archaeon]|nr:hypothetical protein [Candidatus Pacearchaeota archaeon]
MKNPLRSLAFGLLEFGSLVLVTTPFNYYLGRREIKNACEEVGYNQPSEVKSFYQQDINCDGRLDIILRLKNGNQLEFINMSKGYQKLK